MHQNQEFYSSNQNSVKRRCSKDCNYAVLTTLTMKILKANKTYKKSLELAQKNEISGEKNYAIIFLRMALHIFIEEGEGFSRVSTVASLFKKLQNQYKEQVNKKYKNQDDEFRVMAMKRVWNLIVVMRRIFEQGDLTRPHTLSKLVIQIYEKREKKHSKKHQKMAQHLASLIVGILSHGQAYSQKLMQTEEEKNEAPHSDSNDTISFDILGNSHSTDLNESQSSTMDPLSHLQLPKLETMLCQVEHLFHSEFSQKEVCLFCQSVPTEFFY